MKFSNRKMGLFLKLSTASTVCAKIVSGNKWRLLKKTILKLLPLKTFKTATICGGTLINLTLKNLK